MIFYQDLSLLHQTANKKTIFFMEMLSRMDSDQYVEMTPRVREKIISSISPKNKNPLDLARQYLARLVKEGLIAFHGKSSYMINPKISGFSNIDKFQNQKAERFIKLKYKNGKRFITVGVA